ncbi:MAG: efflux RND transporter periplasmic adaptor subunit [Candidatus Eremiobacteraeota bacterium]|nr:efflux RND transporter periplasmic adaptor subunit [Candidatus Eremiobacteraeota bacterium]
MPKWLIIVIVVGALLLTIGIGVATHRGGDATAVTTVTVQSKTLVVRLPENGIVSLPQTATIGARTGGNITRIVAREGQRVTAGALLMKLDDRQISATVSRDAAALAQAEAALKKAEQTEAIAPHTNVQTVALAQQNLLAAQAKLQADVNGKREGQVSGVGGLAGLGISGQSQLVQQQQALSVAKSQLITAKEKYDGDQELYKINALPRQQLDLDKAAYEQALAGEIAAQRQYDLTKQQLHDNAGQLDSQIQSDQRALESATAALASAQLQAQQNTASVDVRSAAASVDSAQAQLQFDSQQLADTEVKAPFDGVIQTIGTIPATNGTAAVQLAVGDTVQPGQTLFTIAGAGPMIVKAQVDEQDIINVRIGQHAFISGEDFPGRTIVGTVIRIAPVVVAQNQGTTSAKNVETTIALSKTYPFLRDGMSADVDIVTGKAVRAVTVPIAAVVVEGKNHFVFVVKNKTLKKVAVRQGIASDTDAVILSGLHEGDVVVSAPASTLKDGQRVAPSAATPAPSASA